MKRFASLLTIVICLSAGCIPGTKVVKNPGSDDCGIRYYRPKPYLLITPHENQDQIPTEEYVRIELEFLPDFSEEYSIHIRPGLGTNQTSVTLEDGWNLTALNVELDSQFSDNVEAVTEGIARLAPGSS